MRTNTVPTLTEDERRVLEHLRAWYRQHRGALSAEQVAAATGLPLASVCSAAGVLAVAAGVRTSHCPDLLTPALTPDLAPHARTQGAPQAPPQGPSRSAGSTSEETAARAHGQLLAAEQTAGQAPGALAAPGAVVFLDAPVPPRAMIDLTRIETAWATTP